MVVALWSYVVLGYMQVVVKCSVMSFMLCAACCVLRAACCVLHVACCVLRAACCVLRAWWFMHVLLYIVEILLLCNVSGCIPLGLLCASFANRWDSTWFFALACCSLSRLVLVTRPLASSGFLWTVTPSLRAEGGATAEYMYDTTISRFWFLEDSRSWNFQILKFSILTVWEQWDFRNDRVMEWSMLMAIYW